MLGSQRENNPDEILASSRSLRLGAKRTLNLSTRSIDKCRAKSAKYAKNREDRKVQMWTEQIKEREATSMADAKVTTDHQLIKKWAEDRGGKPAAVKGTGTGDDPGILRIDFPGYTGEETLQQISWEQFFDKFEKERLAFLYQEETEGGDVSRFSKLINNEKAEKKEAGRN